MKVAGCIPVHFGKEYIAWAVKGMQEAVDEVHIFWAPEPSYGYRVAGAICPDSREELEEQARKFCSVPLTWHTVRGTHSEHEHRMLMHETLKSNGFQIYVLADADEIWDPQTAKDVVEYVYNSNSAGRWYTRFCNFWRSFNWIVRDAFAPIRVVDTRHSLENNAYFTEEVQKWPVFHFGYAQTLTTMRYKLTCHSHTDEFKQRPDWLDKTFIPWRRGSADIDLHPVMTGDFWKVEDLPDHLKDRLKMILGDHPHFGKELIE